jgi:cellulose synthase/poly-beta-1,6-N-acetylglucosamine synthase-like glycosyltransferase
VTEDADLGLRIARAGLEVGLIDSTTYEEATPTLPAWTKQRCRWIRGHIQTYLVNMSRPLACWRALGTGGFFGFQLFIGGAVLAFLTAPVLWGLAILTSLAEPICGCTIFPYPLGNAGTYAAVFGYVIACLTVVEIATDRRYRRHALFVLLFGAYYLLHSVAAYLALWRLIRRPFYWEKTEHGVRPKL